MQADRQPASSAALAHVLVADPAPALRGFIGALLEQAGYRVLLASPLVDLETIKRLQPDVLLIDPDTGGSDGDWQLLERLRSDPATAALPVVVCTGAVRQVRQEGRRLADLGAELVLKPIAVDELLRAIDAVRATRQGRRKEPSRGGDHDAGR